MIESDRFIIGHIPKTGGDAVKQIIESLGLPGVSMNWIGDPKKHDPITEDPGKSYILTLRRLPERELSGYYHCVIHEGIEPVADPAEWILERCLSEEALQRHTLNGLFRPDFVIRSEDLRDDLLAVLRHFYDLTARQEILVQTTPTKGSNVYNRSIEDHFTKDQIQELYNRSPLWREIEEQAYGGSL